MRLWPPDSPVGVQVESETFSTQEFPETALILKADPES